MLTPDTKILETLRKRRHRARTSATFGRQWNVSPFNTVYVRYTGGTNGLIWAARPNPKSMDSMDESLWCRLMLQLLVP